MNVIWTHMIQSDSGASAVGSALFSLTYVGNEIFLKK